MSQPYLTAGPLAFLPDEYESFQVIKNPDYMSIPQIVTFSEMHNDSFMDDYKYLFYKLKEEKRLPLGKLSRYDYDNISVIDIEFKKVRLQRISDVSFNFYPVIKVYFYVRTEDKEMNISEWYSVPGRYEVNESLWLFQDIQIYDYRKAVKSNMTNYLVPILSDYDEAAEAMLKKYQPEALNDPGCINAEQLAEAMGFTIEYVGLSKNRTIHGKAVFSDSNITLYDDNERSYIKRINANTILIDFNACKKRSGSRRDAIIHECVHIYFHRLFFRLQNRYREMLNDDSEFSFDNYFLNDEAAECVRVMERQAARITPRVLMPASSAKIKIEEFMQIFKPYNSFLQIEKTVKKLAEFFSVSIEMAKNRMIELGYTQARGVFDYVDGRYISSYLADSNLRYNKTYTIPLKKLFEESCRNKEFESLILSGRFMYVEGHLCLRDDKYIWYNGKKPLLSPYARNHMSECCLLFTIRHSSIDYQFIPGILNKDEIKCETEYLHSKNYYKTLRIQVDESRQEENKVPDGFYNAFVYYKLRGELGLTDIALEAHIERSRLGRITNEAAEKRKEPTYREVLSLALTICPSAELAIDFIEKSGYNTNKTAEQKFITNLIYLLIGAGIDEFNFAMISAGYQPLYDDTPKSSKKAQQG